MSEAELIFSYKGKQGQLIVDMRIWQLPAPDQHRPHGVHFRLFFGRSGACEVLYDTHTGKSAHRHVDEHEEPYEFKSVNELVDDFAADCAARGWKWNFGQ
jgi:hypothetical protein